MLLQQARFCFFRSNSSFFLSVWLEMTMNHREFATMFVQAMIKGGHMSGWFGDRSESFAQGEVDTWTEIFEGKQPIQITHVTGNAANLYHYNGWSWSQIEDYITRCGYTLFSFRSSSGPAWAVAKEVPSPQILSQVQDLGQHADWRGFWKKKNE